MQTEKASSEQGVEEMAPSPAKQDEQTNDEDTSADKKDTKLKFRWFKSLPLKADSVKLSAPFSNVRILLFSLFSLIGKVL